MIYQALLRTTFALLLAGEAHPPLGSPRFLRAYIESDEVCFEAPFDLSWRNLANKHFAAFPLNQPDRAQLAREWNEVTRQATFAFDVPVPSEFSSEGFILLAETGVHSLRLLRLRGEVSYDLSQSDDEPSSPHFSGLVCGTTPISPRDAGFVVFNTEPPIIRSYGLPALPIPLPPSHSGDTGLRSAYTFHVGSSSSEFLFVRRPPDSRCDYGCCEYSYDVFALSGTVERLAWNAYACDL